jgi:hypothetical protein
MGAKGGYEMYGDKYGDKKTHRCYQCTRRMRTFCVIKGERTSRKSGKLCDRFKERKA